MADIDVPVSSVELDLKVKAPSISTFISQDRKLSSHVAQQLPQFVRQDHPDFINFLEKYYTWMEIQKGTIDVSNKILDYFDIDKIPDEYLDLFLREYMPHIPKTVLADKRLLLKNIKQFYRAKGTEKSFQLLFQALYGSGVDFYYPARDMLRVSDGKWEQDTIIRVSGITGDPNDFLNHRIHGSISKASAVVNRVTQIQIGVITAYELLLNRSSIDGLFEANEHVSLLDGSVDALTFPILIGIDVTDPGQDYNPGDIVEIAGGTGTGSIVTVDTVDENGAIVSLKISDFGIAYFVEPVVVFPLTNHTAVGTPIIGAVGKYPGRFLNDDGKLSNAKFLQDSFFYQQFSYVLLVEESISEWKDVVKNLIHPAGLKVFGGTRFGQGSVGDLGVSIGGNFPNGLVINSFETTIEVLYEIETAFAFSLAERVINFDILPSNTLGMCYGDIEKWKFKYLPATYYPEANNDLALSQSNTAYYSTLANYQIKDFGDMILGDFANFPNKPTNIMPEPVVSFHSGTFPKVRPITRILNLEIKQPTVTIS